MLGSFLSISGLIAGIISIIVGVIIIVWPKIIAYVSWFRFCEQVCWPPGLSALSPDF